MRGRARRAAVFLCLAVLLCSAGAIPDRDSGLPLTLKDPRDGSEVRIEPGPSILHLVFFATWCPPCRDELSRLAGMEARWRGRGYRLVLIAVENRHTAERLSRFIAEQEPPGELLFDAEGHAQLGFTTDRLPTHVLLDGQGHELLRAGGLSRRLEQVVRERLSGRVEPSRSGS